MQSVPITTIVLTWWVQIPLRRAVLDTTLCGKFWQIGVFSPVALVSLTNKTGCHYITGILLKVALNTINPTTIGNSLVVTTTPVTILGCGYGKKCPPLFVYAWIITYTDSQHVINFLTISTTELLLSIRAVTIRLLYDTMRIAIQGSWCDTF